MCSSDLNMQKFFSLGAGLGLWLSALSVGHAESKADQGKTSLPPVVAEVEGLKEYVLPNGLRAEYTWDGADRLTELTYRRSDNSVLEQLRYAYDAAGQRIEKSRLNGTSVPETPFEASYDAANRMTQITLEPNTPQARTYDLGYDASGQLITKQNQIGRAHV